MARYRSGTPTGMQHTCYASWASSPLAHGFLLNDLGGVLKNLESLALLGGMWIEGNDLTHRGVQRGTRSHSRLTQGPQPLYGASKCLYRKGSPDTDSQLPTVPVPGHLSRCRGPSRTDRWHNRRCPGHCRPLPTGGRGGWTHRTRLSPLRIFRAP